MSCGHQNYLARWYIELSQYNFFYDDWLDFEELFPDSSKFTYRNLPSKVTLKINLGLEFFQNLKFDEASLKQYRIDAAMRCAETLGKKPALCFSGGVDSQALVQCFNEANIDIDIFTLEFKNNLNSHDIHDAKNYAEKNNIKINYVPLDVLNFLSRENLTYGEKYRSLSPHFNTHYKLCDILIKEGYTGFVFGGNAPLLTENLTEWDANYSGNLLNYINYTRVSNVMCQGNFLGFDPYLAWSTALLTSSQEFHQSGMLLTDKERTLHEYIRYENRINGYKKAGFNIIPQSQKYTGFELVKKYLEEKTGDGWTFEKLYRFPLENNLGPSNIVKLFFYADKEIQELLKSINLNNLRPCT
jgi:hypothetical protein